MDSHRLERVSSQIIKVVSGLIARGEVKDPRVSVHIALTQVQVSRDLAKAKVGVSAFLSPEEIQKAIEGLNSAAPFLQAHLGKALKTRLTPRLEFYHDFGVQAAFEISQELARVAPAPAVSSEDD